MLNLSLIKLILKFYIVSCYFIHSDFINVRWLLSLILETKGKEFVIEIIYLWFALQLQILIFQIAECSSNLDDSNACELSSFDFEEKPMEQSTDHKKWKQSWLLKLIIFSVALIAVSAIVIVALVVLLNSKPSGK